MVPWAGALCVKAPARVTQRLFDTDGNVGCAPPTFCPILETTLGCVGTPLSW